MTETRTIGIIGGGAVGTALARGLRRVGHDVTIGVRDPASASAGVEGVAVAAIAEAATTRDVVVVAVPAAAVTLVVPTLPLAPGTVLVDATNAVGAPPPDGATTMGELVARLAPAGVPVVKAFNTIGAEHLSDGRLPGGENHPGGERRAFLPVAGDDRGRALVVELAEQLGFDVADLGGAEAIELVEAHARLWIHLALRAAWGRSFAFTVDRH